MNDETDELFLSEQSATERVGRRVYQVQANGHCHIEAASYDQVIVEAPLQILLAWQSSLSENVSSKPLMVTMRTPGHDSELAIGLLLSLGVIHALEDIAHISHLDAHVIEVTLSKNNEPNWSMLERNSISQASCGVCGQKQIQQLVLRHSSVTDTKEQWLPAQQIILLGQLLRAKQLFFADTGGVHAAGLWQDNQYIAVHEDVGRHNAVDKVIGRLLQMVNDDPQLNAEPLTLVLSGRISFELVQKAIVANIPVIVAIGAPSSLAISLAKQFNITLIGFAKPQQFNVYSGEFRIQ